MYVILSDINTFVSFQDMSSVTHKSKRSRNSYNIRRSGTCLGICLICQEIKPKIHHNLDYNISFTILCYNNTSNNQRFGSAFNDFGPRLSLLCCHLPLQKYLRGVPDVHPKIHSSIELMLSHKILNRICIYLGACSSYVKHN